jgi:hypothetical protein
MPGSLLPIELDGIRVDQEAQLDATCTIWREIDDGVMDKNTAIYLNPGTVTIYTGACFFAPIVSRRDRFDVYGEQQIYQNQNRVLVPWDAGDDLGQVIKIGDLLRVTVSEDNSLNPKVQTIKDVLLVSDISLRRLTTVDVKE